MNTLSRAYTAPKPTSAAEAERHADKARADLAATLSQLKDNLQPSHLAHEAMDATRARTPRWLRRSAELATSPSGIGLVGAIAVTIGTTIIKRQRRATRLTQS